MTDKRSGFFRKYRKYFIISLGLVIIAWLALVLLTENKSIAPFVYSIF